MGRAANWLDFFVEVKFESSENLSSSFEFRKKSDYFGHAQMKINSSFHKISSSSNSSSLPRIFASSSSQLRLFSSSAKRSSSSSQPCVEVAKIINFSYTITLPTCPIYVGFTPTVLGACFCITDIKNLIVMRKLEARTMVLKST